MKGLMVFRRYGEGRIREESEERKREVREGEGKIGKWKWSPKDGPGQLPETVYVPVMKRRTYTLCLKKSSHL